MGQIPDKTYIKIKNGHVQSAESPSKYQVTPDGKIYRIESDGSLTFLGNADDISFSHKASSNITKKSNHSWIWIIVVFITIGIIGVTAFYTINDYDLPSQGETYRQEALAENVETSRSTIVSPDTSVEIVSNDKQDTLSVQNIDKGITPPPNSEMKKNEANVDELSSLHSDNMLNKTNVDYYPELACGQMEGPNNFYVLFPEGKTYLCSAHKERIDKMIKNIGSFNYCRIRINGYISTFTGTSESNHLDVQQRTSSVVEYLRKKGVPDNSILVNTHDINNTDFGPYGHVSIIVENK